MKGAVHEGELESIKVAMIILKWATPIYPPYIKIIVLCSFKIYLFLDIFFSLIIIA